MTHENPQVDKSTYFNDNYLSPTRFAVYSQISAYVEMSALAIGRTGRDVMDKPLVSVVIPTHNRRDFLKEALRSVFAQDYRPIEVVVVDDGSTDCTSSVVGSLASHVNDGVRLVYVQQEHAGASAARNRGLQESKGDFVQFLDSDDILHKRKFSRQVEILLANSFDLVTCDQEYFREQPGDLSVVHRFRRQADLLAGFILENAWNSSTVLYRREILEVIGPWNANLQIMQDFEYSCRVCMANPQVGHISEVLFYHRTAAEHKCISALPDPLRLDGVFEAMMSVQRVVKGQGSFWSSQVRKALATRYRWLYSDNMKLGRTLAAQRIWSKSWRLSSPLQKLRLMALRALHACAAPSPS